MIELLQAVSDVDLLLSLEPEELAVKMLFLIRQRRDPDGKIHGTRNDSDGTFAALDCVLNHPGIVALYGFSGGGYNMRQILKQMTDKQRKRLKLVTVVGVDADAPQPDYESSKFPPGGWRLDYLANSGNHMLLPKKLLDRTAKAGIDAVTGVGPIVRPTHKRKK